MVSITSSIQAITPPIVNKWAKHYLKRDKQKLFASWAQCVQACPQQYDDMHLSTFRIERAKLNLENLSVDDFSINFEYLLLALIRSKASCPLVVDFGGALGEQAYILKTILNRNFKYVVVENKSIVNLAKQHDFFNYADFTDKMPQACDIFFSSGTLQSIPSPYECLAHAFKTAKESVILTRNCFYDAGPLFRIQKSLLGDNGPGPKLPSGFNPSTAIYYPHQTIQPQQINTTANQYQWDLILQKQAKTGIYPMQNKKIYGHDLFFVPSGEKL